MTPLTEVAVPEFASGLLSAVDEAWGSLSSLAKCTSHKDMCAIAGARIAKELHKKGATTGEDAFESFKSLCDRFTPYPHTLESVPVPFESKRVGVERSTFDSKFEGILKNIQWSPAGRTTTTSRSGFGGAKRPLSAVSGNSMLSSKKVR